jgi:hypothetical protein
MSDDEGAFVWGGGAGAGDSDSDDDDDGDGDFSNPAQLGGDGDDDGAFVWGGGGGGGGGSSDDSDSDDGERSDSDEGRAAEPQSSLDLLGSLLAGADMTDAIRQPEPEPEPQAAPKKRNKRAGEVRSPTAPPATHCSVPTRPVRSDASQPSLLPDSLLQKKDPVAMMKALKAEQNAKDQGSPRTGGDAVAEGGESGALVYAGAHHTQVRTSHCDRPHSASRTMS